MRAAMADDLPSLRLDQLDPVLEHRVRLAVCVLLSRSDAITFARFKQLLDQTDGNLGAQLRKLEDAGYVSLKRAFVERKPTTWYSLTARGRSALKRHLAGLRTLTDGT
jgi:DNA-binding PadR family transcriptional regulator